MLTHGHDDVDASRLRSTQRKLELLADFERPLDTATSPLAQALLDPPRPAPVSQHDTVPRKPCVLPRQVPASEVQRIQEEYWAHVAAPVPQCFAVHNLPDSCVTTIVPGRAWVVPNLLNAEECDTIINQGEVFGLEAPFKTQGVAGFRTSKRTNNLCAPEISGLINPRLPSSILSEIEKTKPSTAFCGIHPNWRIGKYGAGDFFSAHYDQADSLTVKDENAPGGKKRLDSHHTLLISLSDRTEFEGGATRLFPEGKYDDTAVDVELPRGYALVFEHKLLHAGIAPRQGTKYIAQAGLLRDQPDRVVGALSTFRFGPGLGFS